MFNPETQVIDARTPSPEPNWDSAAKVGYAQRVNTPVGTPVCGEKNGETGKRGNGERNLMIFKCL